MTGLAWTVAILWAAFFLQLILNRFLVPRIDRGTTAVPGDLPRVSIVVPARNEAAHVEAAVRSFCEQDYPELEVVVVDDQSTDGTGRILDRLAGEYARLTVIHGDGPPAGWLGKPAALQRGLEAAAGDWLLFADADVGYDPSLVKRSIAHVTSRNAAMLALLPNFDTRGFWEPVGLLGLYWFAMAFSPLYLAERSRTRLVAAGGGVFNLVRRDALRAIGEFHGLKDAVVDDIGLGFRVKGAGFRQSVARSGSLIRIRMYRGLGELVRGFTKNIFPAMRRMPYLAVLPFMLGSLLIFLPYAAIFTTEWFLPGAIALGFMHLTLLGLAMIFRQPLWIAFVNPVREVLWWWIVIRSAVHYYRYGIRWRDRRYDF